MRLAEDIIDAFYAEVRPQITHEQWLVISSAAERMILDLFENSRNALVFSRRLQEFDKGREDGER